VCAAIALATSQALPQLDADSVPLLAALERRGIDARPTVWSDEHVDWTEFDAVVIRSTWDYFDRLAEFLAWVDTLPVPVFNPKSVVAWNAHKSYLLDLAARGVPVVDTLYVERGDAAEVPWPDAIVKPAVAVNAHGLERVRAGDEIRATTQQLLVQPFLPSIETEGELSLLYAAGSFSHAVRKTPRAGDIRVQPEWGGRIGLVEPPEEAKDVAAKALRAVDEPLLYARADLVRAADGTLRVIELELVEPSLFLLGDPAATARFADAFSAAFAPSP
jgi:glutathione synthase/RimK-type ligase-like ATP-grasp enzyme